MVKNPDLQNRHYDGLLDHLICLDDPNMDNQVTSDQSKSKRSQCMRRSMHIMRGTCVFSNNIPLSQSNLSSKLVTMRKVACLLKNVNTGETFLAKRKHQINVLKTQVSFTFTSLSRYFSMSNGIQTLSVTFLSL